MGVLGGNGQAHAVASMDLVLLRRSFLVGMSICIQLGRWWVFMQYHCGKMKPLTFSITWISSTRRTSTHERERRKQTTLLREHRGGLLPCRKNVVCFCLSSSLGDRGECVTSCGREEHKEHKQHTCVKWFLVKGLCILSDLLKAPVSLKLHTHRPTAETWKIR
jgi:hypothetical protein